jgi:DNA polymerase-3 subunit beta
VRFRIDRDAFADAVAWAARGLPSRPAVPVLAGLVLEAAVADDGAGTPDVLTVSGFDYETSTRVGIPAEVAEPGRVLVLGRLLADISKSLPAFPLDISSDDHRLSLRCGPARFSLTLLPLEDYPEMPSPPPVSGTVSADLFAAAVAQVAIAAGRDDMLPVLTGVHVEVDGDRLRMLATDRYRLAVRDLAWTPAHPGIAGTALIPARVLADAAKAMAHGGTVAICLPAVSPDAGAGGGAAPGQGGSGGSGLVGLLGGTPEAPRTTTTRLLDGEYPKVMSLFPAESPISATLSTPGLLESARRVALVADRNAPIRLSFGDGAVTLDAGTGEEAQASEVLEAETDGEPIEVGFFPGYLLDGLAQLGSPVARFAFTHPSKAVVLTGITGAGSADPDYRYLVMPRRLPG